MNTDAVDKIAMLKESMHCFILGLLSLLPFIGLPLAFGALWMSGRIRKREGRYWNAAKPYRVWGAIFAGASAVLWVVVGCLIAYNLATGAWGNNDY